MLKGVGQTVVYPAISTVLSGIVMAAIGFLGLFNHAEERVKDASIKYIHVDMNRDVITETVKRISPSTNIESIDFRRLISDNFGYANINVEIYQIRNFGEYEIRSLKAHLSPFYIAYMLQGDVTKIVVAKDSEYDFVLPPRTSASLIVVAKSVVRDMDRFTINGKEVPVTISYGRYQSYGMRTDQEFISENYIMFGVFGLIGFATVFVAFVSIFTSVLTRGNMQYNVKSTADAAIAKSVAVINFIRRDDKPRFEKIILESEKIYKHWSAADQ